jgi:hypothetical protein
VLDTGAPVAEVDVVVVTSVDDRSAGFVVAGTVVDVVAPATGVTLSPPEDATSTTPMMTTAPTAKTHIIEGRLILPAEPLSTAGCPQDPHTLSSDKLSAPHS